MPSLLWMFISVLAGNCIVYSFSEELKIEIGNLTEVTVNDTERKAITCKANFTKSNVSVIWYNDERKQVSFDVNSTDFQIRGNSSSVLNVSGKIENQKFEKKFTCVANSTEDDHKNKSVVVSITVPLAVHSSSPKYTCLSQTAKLQCTFRGYPGLTGAKWTNVKDEIVVDDPEEMYKEQSSTSLYVLKATESKSFDCSAAAGDVSTSKQLNVTVRSDELIKPEVEQIEANLCELSWNSSDAPDYAQAYQVRYLTGEKEVTMEFRREMNSQGKPSWIEKYQFPLFSPISNLTVAMLMSECVGPMVTPTGYCNYSETGPDDAYRIPLIVVGTIFGFAILVLLCVTIFLWRQKKKKLSSLEERTVKNIRPTNQFAYRNHSISNRTGSNTEQAHVEESLYDDVIQMGAEQASANNIQMPRPGRQQHKSDGSEMYETPISHDDGEDYISMEGEQRDQIYSETPQEEEIYENDILPKSPSAPKDF